MVCTNLPSSLVVQAVDTEQASRQSVTCDALERFISAFQECSQARQQIHLTLETILASTRADAVFWFAENSPEELDQVGASELSHDWCQHCAERLLAERDMVAQPLADADTLRWTIDTTPSLSSAAMVRVSKSRSAWFVAVTLHPERRLRSSDVKIMRLTRRLLLNQRQQLQDHENLKGTLFGLIQGFTAAIDAKDPYTCGHSERVARIAVRLGQELRLSERTISDLYLAGLLHDIGKIGIRDHVLKKPGRLTPAEMAHIQEHPVIGDRILASIKQLGHLQPGVRNHHERFDGLGYPDHLQGEAIPLMARILAVADSCDAMMSARPYRPAIPTVRIDAVMMEGAGSQWDPAIIQRFMACRHELYSICQKGIGESVFVAVEQAVTAEHSDPRPV